MTGLIEKLIDAVVQNCDTANMNRDAAREDVLQLLRSEESKCHRFENSESGEGVLLHLCKIDRFKIEGPPVPDEFQKVFGAFGTVTSMIIWPQESGTIRVRYDNGMEIKFVPVLPEGAEK